MQGSLTQVMVVHSGPAVLQLPALLVSRTPYKRDIAHTPGQDVCAILPALHQCREPMILARRSINCGVLPGHWAGGGQ